MINPTINSECEYKKNNSTSPPLLYHYSTGGAVYLLIPIFIFGLCGMLFSPKDRNKGIIRGFGFGLIFDLLLFIYTVYFISILYEKHSEQIIKEKEEEEEEEE